MKNIICIVIIAFFAISCTREKVIYYCGNPDNEIAEVLIREGFDLRTYKMPEEVIQDAKNGSAVLIVADSYPDKSINITADLFRLAKEKQLRMYVEYVNELPGIEIQKESFVSTLERVVVSDDSFMHELAPMDILGINECYVFDAQITKPLLVLAKVAGFDKADFGIEDVKNYALLAHYEDQLVAFTKLSNFRQGRYFPNKSWQSVWRYIVSYLINDPSFYFTTQWPSDVVPMYTANATLEPDAKKNMIKKGIDWFYKGCFFVDPSWKEKQLEYQGDGTMPVGLALPENSKNGDGTLGILEGHASTIYHDGNQDYRYWLRNDVQGEVCFALAAGSDYLGDDLYQQTAKNLMEYVFVHSKFRTGEKANPRSAVYGLLGWSDTFDYVFYSDDNARSVLGLIGASSFMNGYDKWNKEVVECILSNLRLSSKNGFFGPGGRLEEPDIIKKGWNYFSQRPDLINPHPHFESWMWACYLWLYDRTGYPLLLEKAKTAISLTMQAYPEKWGWTNGIQQERARMILPLAWLVRVEDSPEHRRWLDIVVQDVLKNQVESGAIREELGSGPGTFGRTRSNNDYGVTEAPLISQNGDPVADMLYTTNFAFFALNEAAHATGNKQYFEAVGKMSDFLTRIQVHSDKYAHLDGAWFRAFDYKRWDYWASNADHGWGAWSTLTGWIQSWIVGTQVLIEEDTSYWQKTRNLDVKPYMNDALSVFSLN